MNREFYKIRIKDLIKDFCYLIIFLLISPVQIFSQPMGASVQHGEVSFNKKDSSLTINQRTDKAIINWQNFSISKKETLQFIQPSNNSAILNRVTGSNKSLIDGTIKANGKVYLTNQNGLIVGPDAVIDTKTFFASTLRMSDKDFLSNKELNLLADNVSEIKNEGTIISDNIYIIARQVINKGDLKGKNVSLIGASEVYLVNENDKYTVVRIKGEGSVSNEKTIKTMEASLKAAGGNMYSFAINQDGLIEAKSIKEEGGKIILSAETGKTKVTKSLIAQGKEKGGSILIESEIIELIEGSKIDATSDKNGGEILIGGDYKGLNPNIRNAKHVFVENDVLIDAGSKISGNGGKVIVWGTESNQFFGNAFAEGGKEKGNGGFIEISSKGYFIPKGFKSAKAYNGLAGTILYDPVDVTLSNAADSNVASKVAGTYVFNGTPAVVNIDAAGGVEALLTAGSNVTIDTSSESGGPYGGNGTITISENITWATANILTLTADQNIVVSSGVTISNTSAANDTTVIDFTAKGTTAGTYKGITISGTITTDGQDISLNGKGGTTGASNYGVWLDGTTGAGIVTTAEGTITIVGTGAGTTSGNYGVYIQQNAYIKSTSALAGDGISITATGGPGDSSGNYGLIMSTGTYIQSTAKNIEITATGGSGTNPLSIPIFNGAYITTGNGNITIEATGGTGLSNALVYMNSTSYIQTTGTGNISITGEIGTSPGVGLQMLTDSQIKTTSTGNIYIEVTGKGSYGVVINNNSIIQTDSGNITLIGESDTSTGILVDPNSGTGKITSASGAISVTGTSTAGSNGVEVIRGGKIESSGSATIDITASAASNYDLDLISTTNGTLGGDSATGDITLTMDTWSVNGATIKTTGSLYLRPSATSTAIGIGDSTVDTWKIADNEIDEFVSTDIQSGTIIGYSTGSHAIIVNSGGTTTFANDVTLRGNSTTISNAISMAGKDLTISIGQTAAGTLTINGAITANSLAASGAGSNDTFNIGVDATASLPTTTINGNAGTNELAGPNLTNTWAMTGANAGTLGDITFSNIQTLTGGSGTDTLTGVAAGSTWTITADDAGTITGSSSFTGMENLAGGTAGGDSFVFNGAYQISGSIDGNSAASNSITGPNVANAWAMTGANAGTLTPTGATGATIFSNIQTLTGGSGTDTLTGVAAGSTWTITADDAGTITGSSSFTGMENLVGGTAGGDSFVFNGAYQISGSIDGTSATGNSITGPNVTNTWTTTGANAGTLTPTGATGATIFSNIQTLTGGSGTDTFNIAHNLTNVNGGNGSNTYNLQGGDVTGAITGGTGNDYIDFTIDGTTITGTIDGGLGGTNTLDYSAYTTAITVDLAAGTATGTGGISNITNILGGLSNNDTIVGPNLENTWTITATDGATITNSGSTITFTNIENWTGGSAKDTFVFYGTYSVTGLVNGGGGSDNTFDYTNYSLPAWVNMVDHTASGVGSWLNIQIFIMNNGGYLFTVEEALDKRMTNYLNISQYWRETLDDYEYGPYFIFYDLELIKLFKRIKNEVRQNLDDI